MSYQVRMETSREAIVLRVRGHLDVPAGRHLPEMACLAVAGLRRAVLIDLGRIRSSTPGVSRLLAPKELDRLPGTVTVRGALNQTPSGAAEPAEQSCS